MSSLRVFVITFVAASVLLALANGPAMSQMPPDHFRIVSFHGGSVALPTSWEGTKGSNGQPFIAQAADGQIQATLSIYYFSPGASSDDDKRVLDRFLMLRLQAEKEGGTDVTLSTPPHLTEHNGTMVATFEGGEATRKRFTAKLAMQGGTLAVVYLEALGRGKDPFAEVAPKIFGSLRVHQK